MDPRFLRLYNTELTHLRESAAEFARDFPLVAGRLALENVGECPDPYVERLLEGFAFLAARVQLKLESEFPRFTQHLLEILYPHYLCPTPSMAVARIQPDLGQPSLASGFLLPRGTTLRTGGTVHCRFTTVTDVTLWPIDLVSAEYIPHAGAETTAAASKARAVLRLRLRSTVPGAKLELDTLGLYVRGGDELRMRLYERLLTSTVAVSVRPPGGPADTRHVVTKNPVRRVGFEPGEGMLPDGPRSYDGFRLLREYFTFSERFFFVDLCGLNPGIRRCQDQVEIDILLDRADPELAPATDASRIGLFSVPVINLFGMSADRVQVTPTAHEFQVVPDRTRPLELEVFSIRSAEGLGAQREERQVFLPLYAARDASKEGLKPAYFTQRREPRAVPGEAEAARRSYVGTEVFISLVDPHEAPWRGDVKFLDLSILATNRALPLRIAPGQGRTDFTLETGAPVESIRCLSGPTPPRPSPPPGDIAWRAISHLSLNYLSLADSERGEGAAGLRDLLKLYADDTRPALRTQIDGVRSIVSRPAVRRIPTSGPVTFGRGLELELTLDDNAFAGAGVFLLGAVLEQFFRRYVSINSFTETVLCTLQRGEVARWPARPGLRQIF